MSLLESASTDVGRRRSSTSISPSWPPSRPSSSTSPRRPRSSGRGNASAPTSCSPRRSRTACSSTSRCKAAPGIEVVFLDTSTTSRRRSGTSSGSASATTSTSRSWSRSPRRDDLWQTDPDELLRDAQGRAARPGPRRQAGLDDRPAPGRAPTPGPTRRSSHLDLRGLVKVNPLATWTDDDIAAYTPTTTCSRTRSSRRATRRSAAGPAPGPSTDGDDPALRPLGRPRQDGVRPPRLARGLSPNR